MAERERSLIHIEVAKNLRLRLKEVSRDRGQTIKGMILHALAQQIPELAEDIKNER